ncbi:RNA-directed DNA polymerase, eukaryota, reverse transcriptase zinc-binding domain protein [Tanacetum coccineum]
MVKLKGRSFWEIEKQSNDSTLWKNLLDLREDIRKHVQYKVGDGFSVSMWHDSWSMLPTLDSVVSRREIYSTGFTLAESTECSRAIKKCKWPATMLSSTLTSISILCLCLFLTLGLRINEGSMKIFSSSQVWNDIRILNDKMLWWEVIWFPHNIPRHAFELWMASKGKLVTQDRLSKCVRSKLLTLKVKDSSAVSEVEEKWGIQLVRMGGIM